MDFQQRQRLFNNPYFAIIVPALLGAATVALAVQGLRSYGLSSFLATPLITSFLGSFFFSYGRKCSFFKTYTVAISSFFLLGIALLAFKTEGLLCLVMAAPLAAAIGLAGTALGLTCHPKHRTWPKPLAPFDRERVTPRAGGL